MAQHLNLDLWIISHIFSELLLVLALLALTKSCRLDVTLYLTTTEPWLTSPMQHMGYLNSVCLRTTPNNTALLDTMVISSWL